MPDTILDTENSVTDIRVSAFRKLLVVTKE